MSELPPYIRDVDRSPPPPPEAVEGQAGRPAVSVQESALPLSGGGAPPVNFPPPVQTQAAPGAGGDSALPVPPGLIPADFTAPSPRPNEAPPPVTQLARVVPRPDERGPGGTPIPPGRYTEDNFPYPVQQGTLTPPKEAALTITGPGGVATTQSPEPAKTQATPPPKQPAPEDAPLATTPGSAALPQPEVSSAPFKGTIPMNGYNYLANKQPEVFNTIASIAQKFSVTPERLIQHARMESDLNLNVPDGSKGEQGPFQIEPKTQTYLQDKYLGGRQLDPKTWEGGATLAALKVRECDQRGADSYASVACYNGGGDPSKVYTAEYFSDKKSKDYSKLNFGDLDKPDHGSTMTANGAVKAARAGPDQFQKYIVDTAPRGQSMSDAWQHVQGLLLEHFVAKGDMDGAEKAQDFVMRQAFMGSNMHLMGAAASLERGDGMTAAQQLAKAHAFFPDGTAGRFMTNGREVFGVRLDEATGKPLGSPFKITAQDARAQLQVTGNQMTFAKFLSDQQKAAADIRLHNAQAGYQEQRPAIEAGKEYGRNVRAAEGRAAAEDRIRLSNQYIDRRQAEANAAAEARAAREKDPETAKQLDEFQTKYSDPAEWPIHANFAGKPNEAEYTRRRATLLRSLKANSPGMSLGPKDAAYIADQILTNAYKIEPTPGGFAVLDKQSGQRVPGIQGIDMTTGELLSGKYHPARRPQQQQQGAAPGGSGAALATYATGNAVPGGRSSVTGVGADMTQRVQAMVQAMPPEIRRRFEIISGYRDAARQREVNPSVTNSRHMHGKAIDLAGDPEVLGWINANGRPFGLGFPLSRDPKERNHLEMIDPRTGARASL